jgi:preprotein translocase subunit YajC
MMDGMGILAMMGAPGAGGAGGSQQSSAFMFIWLGLMVALFYFMLIRPQKRREKERQALLNAVKTGDRVLFAGGLLGVVANVKEKTLIVKIADNVKVEIVRGAVSQVLDKGDVPEQDAKG